MPQWRLLCAVLVALWAFAGSLGVSYAQQHIGSTVLAKNDVTRELSGASAPLTAGENVFRNEIVKTGVDSTAKLVFLELDQSRGWSRVASDAGPVRLRR